MPRTLRDEDRGPLLNRYLFILKDDNTAAIQHQQHVRRTVPNIPLRSRRAVQSSLGDRLAVVTGNARRARSGLATCGGGPTGSFAVREVRNLIVGKDEVPR